MEKHEFAWRYRMSKPSFFKLLGIIEPHFTVLETEMYGGVRGNNPITALLALHSTIRFLSSSTYLDMSDLTVISKSSFYRVVWKVIHIILEAPEFDFHLPKNPTDNPRRMQELCDSFKAIQTKNIFSGCIGAIDGWLCKIEMPKKTDQVNTKHFFSGHYWTYGINVQAMCDGNSKFIYANMDSPGSRNDHNAFRDCALGNEFINGLKTLKETHELKYFIVGDNAYPLSDEVMVPFCQPEIARANGQEMKDAMSTFNFFLSQNCIRVEMAFGMLVNKFRIFKHPLRQNVLNVVKMIFACMKLHNFSIDQYLKRLSRNPEDEEAFEEQDAVDEFANDLDNEEDLLVRTRLDGEMYASSDQTTRNASNESSVWRDLLIEQIIQSKISRPLDNVERQRRAQIRERDGIDAETERDLFA